MTAEEWAIELEKRLDGRLWMDRRRIMAWLVEQVKAEAVCDMLGDGMSEEVKLVVRLAVIEERTACAQLTVPYIVDRSADAYVNGSSEAASAIRDAIMTRCK